MSTAIDKTLHQAADATLKTRSGLTLRLRPVTPRDGALLADLFARMTADDVRFRFLGGPGTLKPEQIVDMIEVDHRHAEHIVAFDDKSGLSVASMMIVADPAMERAEVAIAVATAFRGMGIGWALLHHACRMTKERGLLGLCAVESRANHDALEVERAVGFKASACDSDPSQVLLEMTFD